MSVEPPAPVPAPWLGCFIIPETGMRRAAVWESVSLVPDGKLSCGGLPIEEASRRASSKDTFHPGLLVLVYGD